MLSYRARGAGRLADAAAEQRQTLPLDRSDVAALRHRLSITDDLGRSGQWRVYDDVLAAGAGASRRVGLTETGSIGPETLSAQRADEQAAAPAVLRSTALPP
jgi:hypothetical protein